MNIHSPTLIGELIRQTGIIRSDGSLNHAMMKKILISQNHVKPDHKQKK